MYKKIFLILPLIFLISCQKYSSSSESQLSDKNSFLLLNGGANPRINYFSHIRHLEQLREMIKSSPYSSAELKILSGAGEKGYLDTAVKRSGISYSSPVIYGTGLGQILNQPILFEDISSILPNRGEASFAQIKEAIKNSKEKELFLFVTDHGERAKNPDDFLGNTINLWLEKISAKELKLLVETRDSRTRFLMSQCFSGGFGRIPYLDRDSKYQMPNGKVCGYFSTLPHRMAYGCYPETRAKKDVGHSFEFFKALRETGEMKKAHDLVSIIDQTADVPISSSELFILEMGFIKNHFKIDWAQWEKSFLAIESDEHKKLEKFKKELAENFGVLFPKNLDEIERGFELLDRTMNELRSYSGNWESTLRSSNYYNFKLWEKAHSNNSYIINLTRNINEFLFNKNQLKKLFRQLEKEGKKGGSEEVKKYNQKVAELRSKNIEKLKEAMDFLYKSTPKKRLGRIETLKKRLGQANKALYYSQLKEALLLRFEIKYKYYLAKFWQKSNRNTEFSKGIQNLEECEYFPFKGNFKVEKDKIKNQKMDIDNWLVKNLDAVTPSWLGIGFRPLKKKGEVLVLDVYPESPAGKSGIKSGDIIYGFENSDMTDSYEIKERVMVFPRETALPLNIDRQGERIVVDLKLDRFPKKIPEGTPRPDLMSKLNPIPLKDINGESLTMADGGKMQIVYFWATWCGPCKAAIKPFVKWLQENGLNPADVIAITDEDPEMLKNWLSKNDFPFRVVPDTYRMTFSYFKVTGTPAWVWINPKGELMDLYVGFSKGRPFKPKNWK